MSQDRAVDGKRGIMKAGMKDKMRNGERRTKLKTGGTIAALAASVAVFVCMIQMEKNILTQYEKGVIYTASSAIPRGQVITEENYRKYFEEKELDKSCIPASALNDPRQLWGLTAVFDIDPGVLLTEGMFETLEEIWSEMSEPVIVGLRVEEIYQAANGVLRAGDRIHIYFVGEQGEKSVWESVYVQQVFDASGKSIANTDRTTAAQRMNIYLDKKDVEAFYAGLAGGNLRAVKAGAYNTLP